MKKKIIEPLEQEVATRTSKRKKNPTLCMDKKRGYLNCGICGSENLITCGVRFCSRCEAEVPFVAESKWPSFYEPLLCECEKTYKGWIYHSPLFVTICVDCDALKGPLCPNCKKPCWSKGNKRTCHTCGFRRV